MKPDVPGVALSSRRRQAGAEPALIPMGWSELERLVEEAERDPALRRSLRAPRSWAELALACQRLGYRVTGADLRQAQVLDPSPTHGLGMP